MNLKKKLLNKNTLCYTVVVVFYLVMQLLSMTVGLTRAVEGWLVPICVYVVAAIALNLVVGISGELSLGHAGFMSIGAFSGAIFFHLFRGIGNDIVQLILCMLMGGLIAGLFGLIIGIPVLRLRGDYLAIVTLAFGEIIKNVLNCVYLSYDADRWYVSFGEKTFTAGSGAVDVLSGPQGLTGNAKVATFTVGICLILFTLFIVLNLIRSRHGRAIMAIRDNRIAAESIGLSAFKYKMIAFTTSAALTGMAGALFAMNYAALKPSKFDFNTSILILVYVVLGGMGNILGSILATVVLYVLPELPFMRGLGNYRMLIYAVLLIGVMLMTQSSGGKRLQEQIKGFFAKLFKKKGKGGESDE